MIQLVTFLQQLFLTGLIKPQLFYLIAQLVSLLLGIVVLSQLAGNRPQLLLQELLPLILINLRLRLLIDLVFDLQNLNLLGQHVNQLLNPLQWAQLIQNELLAFKID